MEQLLVVIPLGIVVLCIVLSLLRFGESRAARAWAAGWPLIYAAGVVGSFSAETAWMVVSQMLSLGFAVTTLIGARALSDRSTPRWVAILSGTGAFLLMLAFLHRGALIAGTAVAAVQSPLYLAAAASVWRGAGRSTPLERWLSAILVLLAVHEVGDFALTVVGYRLASLGIWITLSLSMGVFQVGLLADRAHARERKANEALEAERANLLDMLDALPIGIVLEDRAGVIRVVNPQVSAQLGLSDPWRWTGRPARELVGVVRDRLSAAAGSHFDRIRFTHPAKVRGEIELRLAPPWDRVLAVSVLPIEPIAGRLRGRVWVSRDVTEERRMAEALQEAERMETVGTLAGGLAHDFNNQLTAILGNATLLRRDLPDDAAVRQRADDLIRSAEHCAELTEGLLAFARRGPIARDAVELRRVFEDAERLLRPSLPPGVELETSIAPETPMVAADARELQRVVTNLLLNAREAVGEAGRVRLRAGASDDGRVEIVVEDDGPGIDAATLRRVFDPFFTTKGGGTGLGLSIVYGIVQAHGAEIDVRSEPGNGASFHIRWPAAEASTAEGTSDAAPTDGRTGATVLLAEDETTVRRLVREVLEEAGHRVLEAADGGEAVRMFEVHQCELDLVLLDLRMPVADGLEVLAEIRRRAPRLPAIVMSGHPAREGTSGWPEDVPLIEKPCSPRTILTAVSRALDVAPAAPAV